jgi:hypothetical protein
MRRSVRSSTDYDADRSRRSHRRDFDVAMPRIESIRSMPPLPFSALSANERSCLQVWQDAALAVGVDAVEDLQGRPWPCPIAEAIIGIFKRGDDQARWLIVGQGGQWVVASSASGGISRPFDSLADALSLICPMPPPPVRPV